MSRPDSRSGAVRFAAASLASLLAVLALATCERPASKKSLAQDPAALELDDVVPGAIVVDFKDGTTKAQYDAIEKGWGIDVEFNSVEGARSGITLAAIDPTRRLAELLALIRRDPNVEAAEPLYRYHADLVPNDPQFPRQWNLEAIGMREAWDVSQGEGVTVAVIDTGIAYEDHGEFRAVPDLVGARFAEGYDFVNDDEHANDDHGHGTHVAGTIAQRTNNGEGVAGVAFRATLMPVKVLDANGSGTSADIADAIRWAVDHGAKVLNLSLGGGGRSEVMASAVSYARKKGAVVVCAAGNGGRGIVEYPAAYPGAIAVSAVGPSGELAFYSSWGKEVDLAAPGGDKRRRDEDGILQNTIVRGNPSQSGYEYFQGTSMATPHVAGVAALLIAAGATGPDEVEAALFDGAAKKGGAWNDHYGHGVLSAKGALDALGAAPGGAPWWKTLATLAWGLVLWLVTRIGLPRSARMAFRPGVGFFAALAVVAAGLFFLPWIGLTRSFGASALARPVPEWGSALLGLPGINPLLASAAFPLLLTMLFRKSAQMRGTVAGACVGWATYLLVFAVLGVGPIAWIPGFLAVPWLVANAVVSLLLARALQREGRAR